MKQSTKNLFTTTLTIASVLCNAGIADAGTISVQHGTIEGSIGLPISLAYEPSYYVVTDPTGTIGVGFQPFCTFGGTFLDVQINGSANLVANSNPGYDNLTFSTSSGSAEMNFGLTTGLNLEIIAFGDTVTGSLNVNQLPNNGDLGFYDTTSFSSYLLNTPATLSSTISPNLASINTLDALTVWFGVVIPSWLAGINFDINADIGLTQTISGTGINTSAGEIESEGAPVLANVSGGSYQLQDVSENWNDSTALTLGLGADLTADLLWGAVSVTLVNFGNVPLITANQQYAVSSAPISALTFNLPSYSVSATSGSNGKISPSGSTTYYMGQNATFSGTPNNGYAPSSWYLNSSLVQNGGLSYTLTNIQANDNVSVNFVAGGSGPTIVNLSYSQLTSSSVDVNAGVYANLSQTVVYVRYGPSGNLNSVTQPPLVLNASTNKIGIGPMLLSGLPQGTACEAEMVASNKQGVAVSTVYFTTPLAGSAPTIVNFSIVTNANSVVATFGANPNGQVTAIWLATGSTSALGTITPQPPLSLPAVSYKIGVGPITVTGLNPGTTNYIEAVASNALGVATSGVIAFVTPGLPPSATTLPVTGITASTGTANGIIYPNNSPTCLYWEVWTNGGIPFISSLVYVGNGASNINVSVELTNLAAGNVYNVELSASNSVATVAGNTQTFTTANLVPPVLSIIVLSDGNIQLTVISQPGQINVLQRLTDLATTNVVNITTNMGSFVFTDTNTLPCCLYRVWSP